MDHSYVFAICSRKCVLWCLMWHWNISACVSRHLLICLCLMVCLCNVKCCMCVQCRVIVIHVYALWRCRRFLRHGFSMPIQPIIISYFFCWKFSTTSSSTSLTVWRLPLALYRLTFMSLWNSLPVTLRTETSHLYSFRDFWRHFGLSRAAAHNDCCFFALCTNIVTYLLIYIQSPVACTRYWWNLHVLSLDMWADIQTCCWHAYYRLSN